MRPEVQTWLLVPVTPAWSSHLEGEKGSCTVNVQGVLEEIGYQAALKGKNHCIRYVKSPSLCPSYLGMWTLGWDLFVVG